MLTNEIGCFEASCTPKNTSCAIRCMIATQPDSNHSNCSHGEILARYDLPTLSLAQESRQSTRFVCRQAELNDESFKKCVISQKKKHLQSTFSIVP